MCQWNSLLADRCAHLGNGTLMLNGNANRAERIRSRTKKQTKIIDDNYWDCSVCTYRNTPEAFKCLMCDVRKGTSTRKPKINPHLAVHHVAHQYNSAIPKSNRKDDESKEKSDHKLSRKSSRSWNPKKLKNVDRNSAESQRVTIDNVTIMITEYKLKDRKGFTDSVNNSGSTSESSSHSEPTIDRKPHPSTNNIARPFL